MSTALDIIKRSLRLLNVLATTETPDGTTGADCLNVLNLILDQWSNEELMNWAIDNDTYTLLANNGEYTIGATGDLVGLRPIKIKNAFVRDSDNNDYKLELISKDRYYSIFRKTTIAVPGYLSYIADYPNGTIKLYPIPDKAYTLGISHYNQFSRFALITSTVNMPAGYEIALGYALAAELAPEFGKPFAEFLAIANNKKSLLKSINQEMHLLDQDNFFKARACKNYDAVSDTFR